MNMPDVTQAQLLAFLTWIGSQAVAFGAISSGREQLLLSISSTVVAAAWKVADSIIRNGRSRAVAPAPVVAAPPVVTVPAPPSPPSA